MSNPLLGESSPRFTRRPGRAKSDLHAKPEGSGKIFETALDHTRVGFVDPLAPRMANYPPPPPLTTRCDKSFRSQMRVILVC